MFSKGVEWYVENFDQISQFEKWIELVKADLPKQITGSLKNAAEAAIGELESKRVSDSGYSSVFRWQDSWGYEAWWYLGESYNNETEIGAYISAWVPKEIAWLASESDDLPSLGLYYNGGRRSRTKEIGEQVSKAIKKFTPKLGSKIDKIEDDDFVCVRRLLHNELNADSLRNPKTLVPNLTNIFKQFTVAMRPGLELADQHSEISR